MESEIHGGRQIHRAPEGGRTRNNQNGPGAGVPEPPQGHRGRGEGGGGQQGQRLLPEPGQGTPGEHHHDQHTALRQGTGGRPQPAREVRPSVRHNGSQSDLGQAQYHRAFTAAVLDTTQRRMPRGQTEHNFQPGLRQRGNRHPAVVSESLTCHCGTGGGLKVEGEVSHHRVYAFAGRTAG